MHIDIFNSKKKNVKEVRKISKSTFKTEGFAVIVYLILTFVSKSPYLTSQTNYDHQFYIIQMFE